MNIETIKPWEERRPGGKLDSREQYMEEELVDLRQQNAELRAALAFAEDAAKRYYDERNEARAALVQAQSAGSANEADLPLPSPASKWFGFPAPNIDYFTKTQMVQAMRDVQLKPAHTPSAGSEAFRLGPDWKSGFVQSKMPSS